MASRAAGLPQQVEEHSHRVHQQLLGQQGQHRAPHRIVFLFADVVEFLSSNGGAIPGQGAAQQVIGRHTIIITGLDHKRQTGLTDAVFVVRHKGLRDTQLRSGCALTDSFFLTQQGQGTGKFCVQIVHLYPSGQACRLLDPAAALKINTLGIV